MSNIRKPEKDSSPHPPADTAHSNAGPHAKPELMDEDKTPGAGTLAPIGETPDGNASSTG